MSHNNAVTGLRGVVVFLIIFHHYSCRYGELFLDSIIKFPVESHYGGIIGNFMFMIMTGYFMARSLMNNEGGISSVLKYVVNRYWRFWPSYAFSVVLISIVLYFFPLYERSTDLRTIVFDFFLIYHPGFEHVDGSHWFLEAILLIQVTLSLVLLIKNRLNRKWSLIALFLLTLLLYILGMNEVSFLENRTSLFLYTYLVLVGIIIYLYNDSIYIWIPVIMVGCLLLCISDSYIIPLSVIVLLVLFVLMIKYPSKFSLICLKPFKTVGECSFMWYLLHQNIGFVIMYYFLPKGEISLLWLIIPMTVTFILAYFVNMIVKLIPSKMI